MLTKFSLLPAAMLAVALLAPVSVNSANAGDSGVSKGVSVTGAKAITDPKKVRYIIPGVRNAQPRTSTFVHCTNLSNVTETFRFIVRDDTGLLLRTFDIDVDALETTQVATSNTALFDDEDEFLTDGVDIDVGTIIVAATNSKVVCTAGIVDNQLNNIPQGVALHTVRLNPHPGWVE